MNDELRQRLDATSTRPDEINRTNWSFESYEQADTGATAELAVTTAERPYILRDDVPVRVALPRYEQITADGDGAETTYNLAGNIIESTASQDIVLFADGDLQQDYSVDYANNTVAYTDDGTAQELDLYYLTDAPGDITISKVAPSSGGRVEQQVFANSLSLLNTKDQTEESATMSVTKSPLHRYVPQDWTVKVEINAPFPIRAEDDGGRGARAVNMLLEVPLMRCVSPVPGLAEAVKADISGVY